jgi:hypothetical protein
MKKLVTQIYGPTGGKTLCKMLFLLTDFCGKRQVGKILPAVPKISLTIGVSESIER